jgi:NADH dehydrogenase [ubiquinone] 1 alpha subcomplex assembly factor 1
MLLSVLMPLIMNTILLVDFKEKSNIDYWNIVDDGVMGGLSSSQFSIDNNGNAVFSGFVTTENNGGFCSVQCNLKTVSLQHNKFFSIRLKGDGKKYQFRVKSKPGDYYSYIYEFQTATDWQTIEIPISEMYASFRGRTLNMPNYDGTSLSQIAFLISNKRDENFKLLIDKIEVK